MIKNLFILPFLITLYATSVAQISQVEYLEITAEHVDGSSDSSERQINLVVSINDYSTNDSLQLSFVDQEEDIVYQSSNSISGWIAASPNRVEGNTLYLTVATGNHFGLGKIEAFAYTVSAGVRQPSKSYKKNVSVIDITE